MITQVVHQSWLSRLGKSLMGILLGILFFIGATILLAWNEGRAVKTANGLREGASEVIILKEAKSDPDHNDHLVHLSGEAVSDSTLKDPFFDVSTHAIKLRRKVEMLQWKEKSKDETKTNVGGSTDTTTTYTYEKVWSEELIPSGEFHEGNHKNPIAMSLRSLVLTAEPVTLGDFTLNSELVEQMDRFEIVEPSGELPKGYTVQGEAVYKAAHLDSAEIGDLRVTFAEVKAAGISVIAEQQDEDLQPFTTKTGITINMLAYGSVSAPKMFADAQHANTLLTWVLRTVGFFLLFLGGVLVLAPIGVLADVLPFLGSVARFGTSLLALLIAISFGFLTIALAWLAYRPLLGITLLILAVGIPVGLLLMKKKKMAGAGV